MNFVEIRRISLYKERESVQWRSVDSMNQSLNFPIGIVPSASGLIISELSTAIADPRFRQSKFIKKNNGLHTV